MSLMNCLVEVGCNDLVTALTTGVDSFCMVVIVKFGGWSYRRRWALLEIVRVVTMDY